MAITYNQLYLNIRKRLREAGVDEDQLEARELVCFASGKTRKEFQLNRSLYTSNAVEQKAEELLQRRLEGEPVAYLIGEWEFYGLPLTITRDVLIPRSDTEVLAERAIEWASQVKESCRVLDLCTGSGCIGLAVASQVKGCRVTLADCSDAALKVARQNIRRNNPKGQIGTVKADALQEPPAMLGSFDVIVSNPPYIRSGDLAGLDVSVRDYEPMLALDGGEDGLEFYRSISAKWKKALRPGGVLLFEVGYDQAEQVALLMKEQGYVQVQTLPDTRGILRVVEGHLPEAPEQ